MDSRRFTMIAFTIVCVIGVGLIVGFSIDVFNGIVAGLICLVLLTVVVLTAVASSSSSSRERDRTPIRRVAVFTVVLCLLGLVLAVAGLAVGMPAGWVAVSLSAITAIAGLIVVTRLDLGRGPGAPNSPTEIQ
jgi:hypothetical protein